MRYITKMNADNRAFAAALVDMGVRGHIRLVEEDGGWLSRDKTRLERLGSRDDPPAGGTGRRSNSLCRPGESIMMEQKNHEKFSSAKNRLTDILKTAYEGKMFHRNAGWAASGMLLFLAAIWLAAAAVVAATDGAELWQVGVTLGAIARRGRAVAGDHQGPSAVGKCLLSRDRLRRRGGGPRDWLPDLGRGA